MDKATAAAWGIVALGVVFHFVYVLSIFDIYFRSPLVHGMPPQAPSGAPPADRLVLFVADGLRADKLFEQPARGPFLRSVLEERGAWGVSFTHVPTESRPGHVSVIAGFYEDVSAVTKGWKENPVAFDSVFNRTAHTWSFGSPDILPMFAGPDRPHVETDFYSPEEEDFAAGDPSTLDSWSFDHLFALLDRAATNATLDRQLRQPRIVFFLHLLGLDTNGHAHRPYSEEYLANIAMVDEGIRRVEERIAAFYGHDNRTAFVFTADHGMSNRGNHGDGEPANTETPLVAWGAGVRGPRPASPPASASPPWSPGAPQIASVDARVSAWGLADLERTDVNQADIAPLMSSLLGIAVPANSVGVLPTPYLDVGPSYLAQTVLANTRQIVEQYRRKAEIKEEHVLFFKPFRRLMQASEQLAALQALVDQERFEEAIEAAWGVIALALEGLHYFQTYDWPFLMTVVTLGYVGWKVFVLLFIWRNYSAPGRAMTDREADAYLGVGNASTALALAAMYLFLWIEHSPGMFYLYVLFPILFWGHIVRRWAVVRRFGKLFADDAALVPNAVLVLAYVAGLELMVFSYFYREVYSACFVVLGLWGASTSRAWLVSCLGMSVFTLLPVEYGDSTNLVLLGAALVIASSLAAAGAASRLHRLQAVLVVLAAWLVHDTTNHLANKDGLPLANQVASWWVALVSVVLPAFSGRDSVERLVSVFLGFAPPMILLSISYETLFYATLAITLFNWMRLEGRLLKDRPSVGARWGPGAVRSVDSHDVRTAFFFIFFINIAFFGTGNIASISSFEISSTYRFTTIFDPFLMGALLVWKLLIPFVLVACLFGAIHRMLNLPQFSVFLLVICMCDLMALNFFFLVKDYGSWLDIGTSISHFAILNTQSIFVLLLIGISHIFTSDVTVDPVLFGIRVE